ncbi:glycosyltransferase family 4 protein [Fredinandcohnia onubensis]|uniref:glycosyltransferase family 4 protein n=1 Tax=Fredinandcohnia onubensis TaxID=1571209 RepID=UPI000C0BEC24|nr:glycosyltransferase family 4 protein [Fredinandcohnia onubensis]
MKILHLCLASFYVDNYSYQENMLPKYHKLLGLEVEIIASLVSFDENGKSCLLENSSQYVNEHGIPVTRLEYKKSLESRRLRRYVGTFEAISSAKPDIIFIHGCQFLDILQVVKYVKKNPNVLIYVDNHADFSNSATNWLSKNILHKIIWKKCAKLIEPFTEKFYGVLPARVDFLKNVYSLPKEKVELLVMGADNEKIEEAKNPSIKSKIRNQYNILPTDFLIITGGKIDKAKKQTILLMQAIKKIDNPNVKLIVFGSIIEELKEEVFNLIDGEKIQYIGWLKGEDSYKYFASADLAVFPGRHSVYWEQVVGLGIPAIFKKWDGTSHVDIGGNCSFLFNDSVEEIKKNIDLLLNDKDKYLDMKSIAEKKGMQEFSYLDIAKRSIN